MLKDNDEEKDEPDITPFKQRKQSQEASQKPNLKGKRNKNRFDSARGSVQSSEKNHLSSRVNKNPNDEEKDYFKKKMGKMFKGVDLERPPSRIVLKDMRPYEDGPEINQTVSRSSSQARLGQRSGSNKDLIKKPSAL